MSQTAQMGRRQGVLVGVAVIALGAWGATASVVVVGDSFWTLDRELLALLPGAAAVVGGLGMIAGQRRSIRWGGLLALAGGLWFMAGALTSGFWAAGLPALGGTELRMLQWIVFYFGTGVVITLFSAYVLGLLDRPQAVEDPAAVPSRYAARCEPRHRRRAEQCASTRERPHAGARTRVRPRS